MVADGKGHRLGIGGIRFDYVVYGDMAIDELEGCVEMEGVGVELAGGVRVSQLHGYAGAVIVCVPADFFPWHCPCKAVADHRVALAAGFESAHPAAFFGDGIDRILCADGGPQQRAFALESRFGAVVAGVKERLYDLSLELNFEAA